MQYPVCQNPWNFGLFCISSSHLGLARWIAVAILLVAASGWRPRWTALPHWWVTFSLQTSAITLDGGDQVAAVLTLLILPIALTDKRRWHWQRASQPAVPIGLPTAIKRLVARSALLAIRIQVAGIYLHAAVAKWSVPEWNDGTILYYWFNDPFVGAPGWLRAPMMYVLTSPFVTFVTWGALILELLLFAALLMPKQKQYLMLAAGLAFHLAIALTMGLISFGLAMAAALVLYLRPFDYEFAFSLGRIELPRWILRFRRGRRGEPETSEKVTAPTAV
jgi:antimicrobial peptide system SdpB family protein